MAGASRCFARRHGSAGRAGDAPHDGAADRVDREQPRVERLLAAYLKRQVREIRRKGRELQRNWDVLPSPFRSADLGGISLAILLLPWLLLQGTGWRG